MLKWHQKFDHFLKASWNATFSAQEPPRDENPGKVEAARRNAQGRKGEARDRKFGKKVINTSQDQAPSSYHAGNPRRGYGEFKSLREIAVPQGNPAEWVTEVGCGSRQHPGGTRQTPTRSRSFMKHLVKIWSGRVPGASRIGPGHSRNAPERRKCNKSICGRNKSTLAFFPGPFLRNFGTRPGAQNRPKTSPGTKKCVRRRRRKRFLSFFAAVAVRSHSPNRLLEGPTLQNCIISIMRARF